MGRPARESELESNNLTNTGGLSPAENPIQQNPTPNPNDPALTENPAPKDPAPNPAPKDPAPNPGTAYPKKPTPPFAEIRSRRTPGEGV